MGVVRTPYRVPPSGRLSAQQQACRCRGQAGAPLAFFMKMEVTGVVTIRMPSPMKVAHLQAAGGGTQARVGTGR